MFRQVVAIIIIALLIAVSVLSIRHLIVVRDKADAVLDRAVSACQNKDYDEAKMHLCTLFAYLNKQDLYLRLFSRREVIQTLYGYMYQLDAYLTDENYADFEAVVLDVKYQLFEIVKSARDAI